MLGTPGMSSRASAINRTVVTVILAAYCVWSSWAAWTQNAPDYFLGAAAVGIAAIGVVLDRRWSAYLVIAVGLSLTAAWVWYLFLAVRVGVFVHKSGVWIALSLAPGIAAILVAAYCCLTAWAYVGRVNRQSNSRRNRP